MPTSCAVGGVSSGFTRVHRRGRVGVGGSGQHGLDEYAEINTIIPYYRALKDFLERLPVRTSRGRHP
jgi:hypothetical protein